MEAVFGEISSPVAAAKLGGKRPWPRRCRSHTQNMQSKQEKPNLNSHRALTQIIIIVTIFLKSRVAQDGITALGN